jgi:hypothetical protein
MTVIFTGISGINIAESLQKFASDYKEFKPGGQFYDTNPIILKIDTEIEKVFLNKTGHPPVKRLWINKILLLPYKELKEYWSLAANLLLRQRDEIKAKNKNIPIFINLHSCYFHNRTQEYLSLLDLRLLKEFDPALVVTIIDDIYDIHHRLNNLGGIYHDYSSTTQTAMILRYFSLLDWRSKETMMSKFLSDELKKPHYVLAAKHSYTTLFNLIFKHEDKKRAYLSHPITEVRRLEKESNLLAEEIKKEIAALEEAFSNIMTLFLPTTIDEYRIQTEVIKDENNTIKKNYFSVLTPRWDEEKYKTQNHFLYRVSGFNDQDNLWKKDKSEIKPDEEINHLIEALSNRISNQVTTRDYTLVEQSDILLIYRPLFNGNASGGVQEEFRYYNELGKKLCFIFCPTIDIHKFYTKQLNYQVKHHIENTKRLKFINNQDSFEFTDEIWTEADEQIFESKEFLSEFLDDLFDKKIALSTFNETKVPLETDQLKQFKLSFAEVLINSFSLVKIYKDSSRLKFDDNISIDEWAKSIYNYITS